MEVMKMGTEREEEEGREGGGIGDVSGQLNSAC